MKLDHMLNIAGTNVSYFQQPQGGKSTCRNQKGVTLIELLVALVIGLVVSLAVYSVVSVSEGRKRTTTSVNDIDKAGAFAAFQLDKFLRSAGSGFTGGLNPNAATTTTSAAYSFACKLKVTKGGVALLPKAANFSAPFASVPKDLTVAPIVILDGAAVAGDVLVSMAGSGGLSESVTNLTSGSGSGLNVITTASISAEDKVLLLAAKSDASPNPGATCLLDQVTTGFSQGTGATSFIPLAGDYHDTGSALSAYGATSVVVNLGKQPQFNMYGVGANNTLFKYDLLQPAAAASDDQPNPSQFIESVYQMEAIYGITNPAGAVGNFTWQAPTGNYASSVLLAGTTTANTRLQNITLVRVAFLMRTDLPEKEDVSSGTVKLFESTGLTQTISGLDKKYRYKVMETTIPIRNSLVALNN